MRTSRPRALPYYSFTEATVAGVPETLLSRTGYSGELGYELFYPVEYAEHMWDRVFAAGSLARRSALRSRRVAHAAPREEVSAVRARRQRHDDSARSGTRVDDQVRQAAFHRQGCAGATAGGGPDRRIVLIVFETLDFVPPIGASILVGGSEVGKVTSADRGYSVGKALALGYVASAHAKEGQEVTVAGPDGSRPGTIHLRAIYDPDGVRVRT